MPTPYYQPNQDHPGVLRPLAPHASGNAPTAQPSDELLTTAEVAALLKVAPRTLANLRSMAGARGPRWIKLGGAVRYRTSAVREYVAACEAVSAR